MQKEKVILDVDTGSDDAVAIMMAALHEKIDLVACCCVWGNLNVDLTTQNTLELLDKLGHNAPVYRGCGTPMVKHLTGDREGKRRFGPIVVDGKELRIHYEHLEGLEPTERKAEDLDAVSFYVKYLRAAEEPVTIVAVGPLTNLGFAFSIAPDIAEKIKSIIVMGGSQDVANAAPGGEANIWHDPEAAEMVFNCGANVLIVPLDATHAAGITIEDCGVLDSLGTFPAKFAATMARQRIEFENAAIRPDRNMTPIHDALAVCALINPAVLRNVKRVNCHVSIGGFGEGHTVIDYRCIPDESNVAFAYSADKDKFFKLLCDTFGKGEE